MIDRTPLFCLNRLVACSREEGFVTKPKLFFPDEALMFHSLPDQFRIITEMAVIFHKLEARGYASKEALYHAYVGTHRNKHGISCAAGAEKFYELMTENLRAATDMVEMVIDRYFRPFDKRLPPHNATANCLDPIEMLTMAMNDPGPHSSFLQRRQHFEAKRQFGIALQLYSIEAADREADVAKDLTVIEQLSSSRLFVHRKDDEVWAVNILDPDNNHRSAKLHFFGKQRPATRMRKSLKRRGITCKDEFLSCRLVQIGQREFLVYVIPRRKRLFSTLLKLERGRPTVDRRGWKHVLVGVRYRKGIRVATREDAAEFLEHCRNTLWIDPLIPEAVEGQANPFRHPTYWDVKIRGRYHRRDNGRIIAGPAEHIVTTITDHLDANTATDDLNHMLYRSHQVYSVIAPLWFPYKRGPYAGMRDMRLPRYSVNWDSKGVRHDLERWWRSQL